MVLFFSQLNLDPEWSSYVTNTPEPMDRQMHRQSQAATFLALFFL